MEILNNQDNISLNEINMEIKGSNLQNPDHYILLKDRKMVVLNLNYKGMQGQLFYEIWDLQKQSIIKQGKYDITGVNFISQFHKYKEDLVCVLCSRDGAREIVIYDFYENKKENFCQTLPYKDYQVKSLSQIQQLIPVPTQEKMILIEKVFLENDVYDEDTPQYYMFMHIKIIDKNFNSQLSNSFAEFSVRRDYSQEQEEIVVLKGNEQCLIIADQTNGEVMLWDFIKYPHQPVYLSFDCTDYKFKYVYFEWVQNHQLVKFIYSSKIDHMVKILIYDFTSKNTIVQSLKPSQKELIYVGNIKYTNFFFFPEIGVLLTSNQYLSEPDSIYFNVYKKSENSENSNEFQAISDFKHRCDHSPIFIENSEFNYILFQNTQFPNQLEKKQENFEFKIFKFQSSLEEDEE